MCGFAGFIAKPGHCEHHIRPMVAAIAHRGPDDEGFWTDERAGVSLGHRRLAIIDLSPAGHQPMASSDDRYWLVFNGEIYNYESLRAELVRRGCTEWRGHSDTEVLLEAIRLWGLKVALQKSVGMFALALWDRAERTLYLARDRFGEKPLYYGWAGGNFLFGSELKAIRAHPAFQGRISRDALRLLASRTYIPAPLSIYEEIFKLEPATILAAKVGINGELPGREELLQYPYWDYRTVAAEGVDNPFETEGDALSALEDALTEAVCGQSVADVPIGTFLSGGIDSSTVVALLQKQSSSRVRTFSIGFSEPGYNEAEHAKQVAAHFGTEHAEQYVTSNQARDVIPLLPSMFDEPFADSSQIPTYLVSRFAREQVTVAMSGDGADELFGGYNRYASAARTWGLFDKLPRPLRQSCAAAVAALPPAFWNRASAARGSRRADHYGTKIQRGFETIALAQNLQEFVSIFLDQWAGGQSPVRGGGPLKTFDLDLGPRAPDPIRMMYSDVVSYLPDDILCKVDRASMAVSLETRAPFLDHRVANVAARIPLNMKIRSGTGKWILRQLLYRHAPAALFERPKAGFAVPIGQWLRGPLRAWAEELLDERRLNIEGYFDAHLVRKRWAAHLAGGREDAEALWPILMFQAWQDETKQ